MGMILQGIGLGWVLKWRYRLNEDSIYFYKWLRGDFDLPKGVVSEMERLSKESALKSRINKEGMDALVSVHKVFAKLFSSKAKMLPDPYATNGDVEAEVRSVALSRSGLRELSEALSKCHSFSIVPLIDGRVRIDIMIQGIYSR